ncbi:DUF1990 family protein [Nocardioides marmoraquaticus]
MSLTYPGVGATRGWSDLPDGHHALRVRRRVSDADRLDDAAHFVLGLGMQRATGLRVPDVEPAPGTDVVMRLGVGRLAITVPTQVVYVLDEPDRRGFAYGTLPGHPESGEELFLVERVDGATYGEVRAFSRPAGQLLRLAGPAGRLAQRVMAGRYLAALERHLAQTA